MSSMMGSAEVAGRDEELEAIAAFVDVLRTGPNGLAIEGEAGIGKTTLWEAAVEAAEQNSLRVFACRPAAAEAGLTFATPGDLLADIDPGLLEQLPEPQRDALSAALLLEAPRPGPLDQRAVGVALL